MNEYISHKRGLFSLSPILVFVIFYLTMSLHAGDFYLIPVTVSFLVACIYSFLITRRKYLQQSLDIFCQNAGRSDVMLMVLIFILAGAFASTAKAMGSIQSTVDLTLMILPSEMIMTGLFLASCFVSLSIGTSVGTIASLTPIAVGIAEHTGVEMAPLVAVIVGGSFFGDNLSFISDTTIMATKTQNCKLSDKFRTNIRIAVPAAVITLLIYTITGFQSSGEINSSAPDMVKVLPYLFVLVTAIIGVNVILVLIMGTIIAGITGICVGAFNLTEWLIAMNQGIMGMSELILVTLLAAGLMGMIRNRGGIQYLMQVLTRKISSQRGAELSIASLVILTDLCTANNTIAILTVGPVAQEISQKFGIDPRRSASLLDTCSCFAQGLIPYGAQLLIAAGLAALNPVDIIPYLYYPFVLGGITLFTIIKK